MAVIAYRVIVDHLLQAFSKLCETGLWREKKERRHHHVTRTEQTINTRPVST